MCMLKDGLASSALFMDTSSSMTFVNFGQHFCDGQNRRTFDNYRQNLKVSSQLDLIFNEQRVD